MRHRRGASIARSTARFPRRLLEVCKEAYLGTFAAFAAVLSSTAAKVGVGMGLGTKLANAVNAVVAPVVAKMLRTLRDCRVEIKQ